VATAYLATRISPHLAKTADDFLLCKDVVVARSGPLEYRADELDIPGGTGRVIVWRPAEEVTSRRFLASIEGAVVTDQHPGRFVDPGNFQVYARGHAQNARIGSTDADGNIETLADLFIADQGLAAKVESGAVRDVSIGFDLQLDQDAKGRWVQKNLRVNHIAIVPHGRAGSTRIMDAAPHLGFVEMADLYLRQDPAAVIVPKFATDSIGETAMEPDDLIQVEPDEESPAELRDAALDYLRRIRPQVARSSSDDAKQSWNMLFCSLRDVADPQIALDNARRLMARDSAFSAEDARIAVAANLVSSAAEFFGKDVAETAAQLRTSKQRACRSFDARRSPAENFVAAAEAIGEAMRNRR
jgi:hypothetical protein